MVAKTKLQVAVVERTSKSIEALKQALKLFQIYSFDVYPMYMYVWHLYVNIVVSISIYSAFVLYLNNI